MVRTKVWIVANHFFHGLFKSSQTVIVVPSHVLKYTIKNLLVEITICTFTIFYHRHSYKKYTNLQFHPDMLFVFLFAQLDFENQRSFKIVSQKIGAVPVSKQHRITWPPHCSWWTAQPQNLSRPVIKILLFNTEKTRFQSFGPTMRFFIRFLIDFFS